MAMNFENKRRNDVYDGEGTMVSASGVGIKCYLIFITILRVCVSSFA